VTKNSNFKEYDAQARAKLTEQNKAGTDWQNFASITANHPKYAEAVAISLGGKNAEESQAKFADLTKGNPEEAKTAITKLLNDKGFRNVKGELTSPQQIAQIQQA